MNVIRKMKTFEEIREYNKKNNWDCQTCGGLSVIDCFYCKERVCFSCNFTHCATVRDFGKCKKNIINGLNRSVDRIIFRAINPDKFKE